MKIAYYMPFKPMDHRNPSGDLVTGTEIYNYLAGKGHAITLASRLRCRWIYYRPLVLLQLLREKNRILRECRTEKPDLWLSYHSYYKAPDLLGSTCSRKLGIPYVIFQGIYSTKQRRRIKTLPGYLLNRQVLQSADHIFTNKQRDFTNLKRLIPENRLSYIGPGIQPQLFRFADDWRLRLRRQWAIDNETIVMTAAMMRPGVKTEGIGLVIESCSELAQNGFPIRLIIAGDGTCRQQLEQKAAQLLPDRVQFLGKVPRSELYRYYSAADIFAFPGIQESLGMVYLEAQSCNLPVVAYRDWGGGEAVVDGQTGLLSPAAAPSLFTKNIQRLIEDKTKRDILANAAGEHIRHNHDLDRNYRQLEQKLVHMGSNL
ncbi:glycosyltransferase family 4 protein [Desulfopila sp. IMCC35006]|uniref:glycosyltransferase family 4 protein n=1 Tax=Desulfopila sp. IMCC35006 TaxID=2569542 RepID=UPI0010AC36AA|nr:glycosyltransferase family 4 protein [Desulfopila sp. IMCC35006]TKB26103.1 glycosyltransferase family 4 protein [Desulfopila sp. IMCC35006]